MILDAAVYRCEGDLIKQSFLLIYRWFLFVPNAQKMHLVYSHVIQSLPDDHPIIHSLPIDHPIIQSLPNDHPIIQSLPNDHPIIQSLPNDHPIIQSLPGDHPIIQSLPNDHLLSEAFLMTTYYPKPS